MANTPNTSEDYPTQPESSVWGPSGCREVESTCRSGPKDTCERRVLVVDDNPINVKLLRRLLSGRYHVESAETGDEALRRIPEFRPEVVLLDIEMPGLSGYEVCHRIKSSPIGPLTQVIMVSGKASAAERVTAYQRGADDYVAMPFDDEELLAKVQVHLRLREANCKLSTANELIRLFNE